VALIDQLAESIARFEGFFAPGSLAERNRNPGNLTWWGDRPTSGGYAVFDTVEQGWEALRRQIELNIGRGLTLREFFGGKVGVYPGYAPAAAGNDPESYASFVAGRTGIPLDVPLVSVEPGSVEAAWLLPLSTAGLPGWLLWVAIGGAAVVLALLFRR